jgi:hypothetical protein
VDFEPLHPLRQAEEQSRGFGGDPKVPNRQSEPRATEIRGWRPHQTHHQPERDREHGVRRPTVNRHVEVRWSDPAEGEPGRAREQIGEVQLEAGERAENRTEQQPHERDCECGDRKHSHRLVPGLRDPRSSVVGGATFNAILPTLQAPVK